MLAVMPGRISYVVGFDDFPFEHAHRSDVFVVGAVYAGVRLDGILRGTVRRDGANATSALADLVARSKFAGSIQLVMLQGIALAGFNVVDIHSLSRRLSLPVLVVTRRPPNMETIRGTLLTHVRGGARKWRIIGRTGPMEPVAGVWVQRAGISLHDAGDVISRFAIHGNIPEPLRAAHLIASGIGSGQSRGRV